jgi:precorrin-4/cobalt-precorrin-4 C11-methyltransferase
MVYFVGAGPGAKDLITVRAMKLLQLADVIIYAGSLVNEELLEYAEENCEIYNSAYMNLEEVLEVVKATDKNGKTVVRLHTGDASIYGAIREQMEELDKENIKYEIVPGVSSFLAAAAALKCEYTVPEISQSVILTRMEGRTPVPEAEKISRLAEHGTSMVVFLSMGHLKKLHEELLKGSYTEDTPCAIVYKASWKEQKCVKGTLKNLEEMAEKNNITKTALVLVGDFLGTEYNYSKLYDAAFETEYRK